MPMYEYLCSQCDRTTETLRSMDQADDPTACEHCGSRRTKRVQSVFAVASPDGGSEALPATACGRCGDPRGSCSMS